MALEHPPVGIIWGIFVCEILDKIEIQLVQNIRVKDCGHDLETLTDIKNKGSMEAYQIEKNAHNIEEEEVITNE